jgi:hypothetical protein
MERIMAEDKKLFRWLGLLLILPVGLAVFGGDRFRYPCQDPQNWDKEMCQLPQCDVTRTCPEHVFKGQIDPRTLGKGKDGGQIPNLGPQAPAIGPSQQGVNCGK